MMCTRIGGQRALPFHAVDVNALPIGAPIPLNTFPSSSQRKGTRKHHQFKTLYVPGRRRFLEHPSRAESDGEIEIGFNPRKRKLSQAQDVVARTRAHWGELQRADKENIPLALDIAALREGAQQDENAARRDANGSVRASSEAERTLGGETKQGDDTQDTPSTPRGSSQTAAVIDSLAIPPAVPRPRPRSTRRVRKAPPSELEPYEIEAMRMVIRHAKAGKGQFPCMRSGCGDILESVDGLARHLYIHDLVPDSPEQAQTSSFGCDFCGGTYESERELLMHDCPRYRGLLPSPKPRLKGTTRRFIETFKLPKLSLGCFNIISSPVKRTRYD